MLLKGETGRGCSSWNEFYCYLYPLPASRWLRTRCQTHLCVSVIIFLCNGESINCLSPDSSLGELFCKHRLSCDKEATVRRPSQMTSFITSLHLWQNAWVLFRFRWGIESFIFAASLSLSGAACSPRRCSERPEASKNFTTLTVWPDVPVTVSRL